jgi:hypothetical protein
MIPRRGLLGHAMLGGVVGMLAGDNAADAASVAATADQQISERAVERIAEAIAQLRAELRTQRLFTEIEGIRDAQKQFLRANAKFPDFIDVGTDLWFAVHDWHVRWQQPLTLGRDGLGRYTVMLNSTTVIMRAESVSNYMSLPYDNK